MRRVRLAVILIAMLVAGMLAPAMFAPAMFASAMFGSAMFGSTVSMRAHTGQSVAAPPSGPQGQRGALPPGQPGQRGGGRGRGAIQVMTLTSPAWSDGGAIPPKYTQAGDDVSPPLAWSGTPEGTAAFVLIVHDVDAAIGPGTDDVLHWMIWNIPATATGLSEHVPQGPTLPDGARQISATGPMYRGPGALASGPAHHYLFELFALDATLDVPAVGAPPVQTRAAVMAAMAGHVRGKAAYVGVFKRSA
jgi:Raf kinase inhibitor-like YbhB/YbcL family protein